MKCILFKDLILDILQNLEKNSSIALTLMYLLHLKGGNREQTLPTKSNPNPDLTDAGDAENRYMYFNVGLPHGFNCQLTQGRRGAGQS